MILHDQYLITRNHRGLPEGDHVAATLTLALGTGATATVFSLLEQQGLLAAE